MTLQNLRFQEKTFCPSKIANGIRLNTARKEFIAAPATIGTYNQLDAEIGRSATSAAAITMLTIGPAMAVRPIRFLSAGPEITTAPGAMNFNGDKIETAVSSAPIKLRRNSAHSP